MQTSFFPNRFLLIAIVGIAQMLPAEDLDVRVADGTDIAILIDFDGIRRSGADFGTIASDAIDDSVRGKVFGESTGEGMKNVGRIFAKGIVDTEMKPQDFHWVLCGLRAAEFYVSDRRSITQQVWSVAAALDNCDWRRLESVAIANGFEWQRDSIFGHHVFNAVKKRGKVTGHIVRCVPGDGEMAFFGSGASREWECYNADALPDADFAGMGRLADGEIARIWIIDDKPLSKMARHLYRSLYPTGAEEVADRMHSFKLSIFFGRQTFSAELKFSCADSTDAESLAKAFLAAKTPEGIADMVERFRQSSGGNDSTLRNVLLAMKKDIVKHMEVSCLDDAVIVKTGFQDTKSAIMILLGSIGSFVDFFETFFR